MNELVRKYQNDPDDELSVSLRKLTGGKEIKDIVGYISNPYGVILFNLSHVQFTDGTYMWFEGEHDVAYLYGGTAKFVVDLEDLRDEEDE